MSALLLLVLSVTTVVGTLAAAAGRPGAAVYAIATGAGLLALVAGLVAGLTGS